MDPSLVRVANFFADFGELVAILPAALAAGLYLALARQQRRALAFWLGIGAATAAVAALKAAHLPVSGHAAVAATFEGGLALLMLRDAFAIGAGARAIAAVLAIVVASVCVSVWLLGWHSLADVASGLGVGLLSQAPLARIKRAVAPREPALGRAAFAVVLLLVGSLHGVRLTDWAAHGIRHELQRAMVEVGPVLALAR